MKTDIYETITNKIVAAIEAGAGAYEMPWNKQAGTAALPINAQTGKNYRGVNILTLWADAQEKGYPSNEWATYQQWSNLGAQVRKGEKSNTVVFWKFMDEQDNDNDESDPDTGKGRRVFARGYPVFNAAQVDGYTPKTPVIAPAAPAAGPRIPEADQFFANLGMDLRHGGNDAFFSPTHNFVQMPEFEAFKTVEGYYSVLSHESTHWTGHKSRLDRDLTGRFGNEKYAMEELIAELGAAFTMGNLGLANEPRPDHATYIQSWLKVLKSDSRAIFTAASKAQAAADFLLEKQAAPGIDPELANETNAIPEASPEKAAFQTPKREPSTTTAEPEHYSEAIIKAFVAEGWTAKDSGSAEKTFANIAGAGQLSNGDRTVTISFEERGRYLIAYLGWDIIADIDGRDYQTRPAEAVKALSEKIYQALDRQPGRKPEQKSLNF